MSSYEPAESVSPITRHPSPPTILSLRDQLQHLAKPPIRLILLLISTIFFFVRHRVQRGVYLLVNISCRCTRIHGTTIISQLILSYAFLSSCFASWALRTKHTTVIQVQVIISKKKLGRNFKRQTRRRVSEFLSYTNCLLRPRSH